MNNTFAFVLCIIAIVMCANIIKTYLRQRNSKTAVDAELEETLAKIEVLEERIQVLERIVTEHRFDLRKEIDQL